MGLLNIILGWCIACIIRAYGFSLEVKKAQEQCIILLPHERLENAEGSFVVSENVRVDFYVSVLADGWADTGKEIYRRNYQMAANFDVKAGSDVPVGFVYNLCWNNRHSDNAVNIFFKQSTMLIDFDELRETGTGMYKVAKLLSQLENQLKQEQFDFRERTDAAESTLENILWVCVVQFILLASMALLQARSMRKLFETQLMI